MTNLELALRVNALDQIGKFNSKVTSRRNWVVMTWGDTVYVASYGVAKREGWFDAIRLTTMVEMGVTWSYFTYASDARAIVYDCWAKGIKVNARI